MADVALERPAGGGVCGASRVVAVAAAATLRSAKDMVWTYVRRPPIIRACVSSEVLSSGARGRCTLLSDDRRGRGVSSDVWVCANPCIINTAPCGLRRRFAPSILA